MSKEERPLPEPPSSAFGRKKGFEQEEKKESLIAERMAMAMAEGKLEEFLKSELPDSDQARALAAMMLGMTGMLPPEGFPAASPDTKDKASDGANSDASQETTADGRADQPVLDTSIIDRIMKIASENNLSPDWVISRALKLYVDEYLKTGRL